MMLLVKDGEICSQGYCIYFRPQKVEHTVASQLGLLITFRYFFSVIQIMVLIHRHSLCIVKNHLEWAWCAVSTRTEALPRGGLTGSQTVKPLTAILQIELVGPSRPFTQGRWLESGMGS